MARTTTARVDAGLAAALALALGALYWHGRCPTFGPGDSPLLVLQALTGTGSGLYGLLARLAAHLPGSPAAAVNGLSGILEAAACGAFFLLLRDFRVGRESALFATLLLAFSKWHWYYAEIASVASLQIFLAVLAAWLALKRAKFGAPFAALLLISCLFGPGEGTVCLVGARAGLSSWLVPGLFVIGAAGFFADALVRRTRPVAGWILIAATFLAPALWFVDLSRHNSTMEYARALVRSSAPGDILVVSERSSAYALEYLKRVDGVAAGRVILSPQWLDRPECRGRLQAENPKIVLPPGPFDWSTFHAANPRARVLAEASYLSELTARFPASAPAGVMIELRDAALPKTEVARRAADVVDWDEVTSLRRWDRYYFTEESALRNSYRAVLSRYRDLAGRSDRLEAHLRDL